MTACGKLVTGYNSPDRANPAAEHWVELRTGYPCSVETESSGGHSGPCAAVEQPQTVSARQRWLEANRRRTEDHRTQASGLGETQGRPLTFAENVGADPAITHPAQEVPCPLCEARVVSKDLPDHLRQVHASTASTAVRSVPGPQGQMSPEPPVPTRKDRKYDQHLPEPNERPIMHEVLIGLVAERLVVGVERYGHGLQPLNGRDGLRDLVEELVDAAVYALQMQYEKAEMLDHVMAIYDNFAPLPVAMQDHFDALMKWLEVPIDDTVD